MRIFLFCLFDDAVHFLIHCTEDFLFCILLAGVLLLSFLLGLVKVCSDVLHIFEEGYSKAFAREFLASVHRPVSVLEVVVFYAAELLYVSVAAVVVCDQKTFA